MLQNLLKDIIQNKICPCWHRLVQVRLFMYIYTCKLYRIVINNIFLGWVCYAEKAHGYILPNISTAKSPQQVIGSLVKDIAGERGMFYFDPCYII